MKIKELLGLSREELVQKERTLKEELAKLNAQRYAGRVDKPHMFSLLRKDIAKIETILHQKKEKGNG